MMTNPAARSTGQARRFASPVSRALARTHGVDLSAVAGSGPQGRVVRADIQALLGRATTDHPPVKPQALPDVPFDDVPNGIGRTLIARRLTDSKQQVPHIHLRMDCNMDAVLRLRGGYCGPPATRPSINAYVLHAAALALKAVPGVNASYTDAAIRRYRKVNIGMAVAVEDGLLTPVINDADLKSVAQIAHELAELMARARSASLAPGSQRGATFTVSSLGSFGVPEFTAVINPPQAAILAVGVAEPRAVVLNGQLAVATMMTVVLAADHRAVDGALAARWLATFKNAIEKPTGVPL